MRLSTLAVLAPLLGLAAADSMVVKTFCWCCGCNSSDTTWRSAYGNYPINANEGCRDSPDVPGMNNICMDWGKKRGHFYFDGQAKRCLVETSSRSYHCAEGDCSEQVFSEVACTW